VIGVTTQDYFAAASGTVALRPRYSVLDLSKIEATGYVASDVTSSLASYLRR
jgi:dTDP-4-dehydrorhamnose reductase